MHSAGKRGFTLIELLVAISILGIIAVLGWRGLDSIVRACIALTADLEQTRGMQLAFAQLQSDCGLIVDAAMLSNRTNLLSQPNRLLMVRKVYAENQPTQLQVVAYRLKDGALQRSESNATRDLDQLDQFWQAALIDAPSRDAVTLKTGVDAMSVLAWDGAAWSPLAPSNVDAGAVGAAAPISANPSSSAAPIPPLAPTPAASKPATPSGLQITLQLHDQQAMLVKAFLLGAI